MTTGALWALTAIFLLDALVNSALVWVLRDTKAGSLAIALTAFLALANFAGAGYCIAAIALR